MAILHGTVVPVLQIDEVYFHALAFVKEIPEGHTDLTISYQGLTASKQAKVHEDRYEIKELIDVLKDNTVERVFGLVGKFKDPQVVTSLNFRKGEIIDYLQNLRSYYEMKDLRC